MASSQANLWGTKDITIVSAKNSLSDLYLVARCFKSDCKAGWHWKRMQKVSENHVVNSVLSQSVADITARVAHVQALDAVEKFAEWITTSRACKRFNAGRIMDTIKIRSGSQKLPPFTLMVSSGQCGRLSDRWLQLASCLVQALRTTSDDDDFLLVLRNLWHVQRALRALGVPKFRTKQQHIYMVIATPKVPSNIGVPNFVEMCFCFPWTPEDPEAAFQYCWDVNLCRKIHPHPLFWMRLQLVEPSNTLPYDDPEVEPHDFFAI